MNGLIEKSQQMTTLLIEYREAKKYESCLYHVVKEMPHPRHEYFMLFDIVSQKMVRDGSKQYIQSWLNRRKVPDDKVYNIESLK